MSGRRSHPRYAVATPWDGAMRVLRDVVIQRTDGDELQAVSQVPGISGEEMTLDLMGAGTTLGLKVRVIESRPVMVEGAVRHSLRLALVNVDDDVVPGNAADAGAQAEAL
jgi:hypothetical protein